MPNETHNCPYVGDIAILNNEIPEIKSDIKKILKILQGDNGEGLTTKVAVLKSRIRIFFWLFGLIGVSIVKIAFFK